MDKPKRLSKEELRSHKVVYGRPEFDPDDGPVPDDQLLAYVPAFAVVCQTEQVYLLQLRLCQVRVIWPYDPDPREELISVGFLFVEDQSEVYATPQEAVLAELLADLNYYQKGLEYTRSHLERVQKLR